MKVFILTEGGRNIGFGHVTRCASLYDSFTERGITPTLIINGDSAVKQLIKNKDYNIFNWLKDKVKLSKIIRGADIAVVDSYLAGEAFYAQFSKLVKVPAYIDDCKRLDYPTGIVINGTIGAEKIEYPAKDSVTYLIGSQYTLLRKEYRDAPEKMINDDIQSMMLTFGGDDSRGMTPKILRFLNKKYPAVKKYVIIGKAFNSSVISAAEKLADKNVNLIYEPSASKMKAIMIKSDVAISAGGQTLFELARIGVPTIAVCVVDNQLFNIKGLKEAGFLEYAGWYNRKDILGNIDSSLKLLKRRAGRQRMSAIGRDLIDGKGAARVVKALLSRRLAHDISIRMADFRDAARLIRLANDSTVRANSFNSAKIKWNEHIRWFKNRLDDKNCLFLVAEKDGKFCGQVRFDINSDKKDAVINISLKKDVRGLGLASFVIDKAIGGLLRIRRDIETVTAYIKEDNVPSFRSFKKSGFEIAEETVIKGSKAKVFTKEVDNAAARTDK